MNETTSTSDFAKRLLLAFVFLSCCASLSHAQPYRPERYWETGVMGGLIQYSGDVADKRFELKETHAGYGAFFRYHLSEKFGLKANIYGGVISGKDVNSPRPLIKRRNFVFATSILEIGLVGEWYILGQPHMISGFHNPHFSPFVFGGIAGTFTNNDAQYYGSDEDRNRFLKVPLPEEGIAMQFICVPLGGGIRYDLNDRIIVGAEAGARLMFSDGIDGISANGNPERNDWYYFGGATISYIIGRRNYTY